MKMKKPSSMATVLSRTCPRCFSMVDPVWYGWHISKCSSSNKQDIMDSSTTHNNIEAGNSQLVVVSEEASALLPAACTLSLAPDSQFIEENRIEENPTELTEVRESEILRLRAERQALVDRVTDLELKLEQLEKQFKTEKQALTNKVKGLELNVKELECQLSLSKECEGNGGGEAIKHTKEAGICGLPMEITTLEPTALCSGKLSLELANNGIYSYVKEGEEVLGRDGCSGHSKQVEDAIVTENVGNNKPSGLDHVVDLACAGEPVSLDFLSCVDEYIDNHKASSTTKNTCQTQQTGETTWNATNEDRGQDILAKIDHPDTTEKHIVLLPNYPNAPPSTLVPDEEGHTVLTDTLGTPFGFSNDGSLNNNQKNGNGDSKPNGYLYKTTDYGCRNLDSHEAASEMQCRALDKDTSIQRQQVVCDEKSHANQAHSHSCSSSSELGIPVVKAKPGLRRIVLSDFESEGGNMQAVCDEKNDESDFGTRNIHAEIGKSRAIRPSMQQLRMVRDVDDLEHGKHTGVRRSKRLRRLAIVKSQNEEQGTSSMKKSPCTLVASSSSAETSSFCPNPEATADTHKKAMESTVDMHTTPSSKRKLCRRVEVPSSSSAESSGQVEQFKESMSEGSSDTENKAVEFVRERSRRPLKVQKRLFAEVESKPAIGSKHSMDSEDDDSEIESDADSLKDFITDSEGTDDSGSFSDDRSSSRSHSLEEVYCNPRLERDFKIRHYVWELEAEMLAAFAVNPELCLRAVCAINRRQTEDEQIDKISKYLNKRGFDKLHARRGSRIADFLTDGDPSGPVKKSVKDLEKFDAGGLELCKMLAAMHSKQLFDIYKKAEDPHFPFA